MNTTQWILAIVFSLFIPITLAYLEAMSERFDVSDKGLITDRSEFPIRTALEEIKDPLLYAIHKETITYGEKIALDQVISNYTKAANWLFLHNHYSKEYNSLPYLLSGHLEAGSCFVLAIIPIIHFIKTLPLALATCGAGIIVFMVFNYLFSHRYLGRISKYQSMDFSSKKLPRINQDSSVSEIVEYYEILIYPHIDRVQDQCEFMKKKSRSIKISKTVQDFIILLLFILDIVVLRMDSL